MLCRVKIGAGGSTSSTLPTSSGTSHPGKHMLEGPRSLQSKPTPWLMRVDTDHIDIAPWKPKIYPLVMTRIAMVYYRWPIEIDGLPIKNGDFPWQTVSHNQMVMENHLDTSDTWHTCLTCFSSPFKSTRRALHASWKPSCPVSSCYKDGSSSLTHAIFMTSPHYSFNFIQFHSSLVKSYPSQSISSYFPRVPRVPRYYLLR